MYKIFIILFCYIFFSCDQDDPSNSPPPAVVYGCTDEFACNYDIDATDDNASCSYDYCSIECEIPDRVLFINELENNELEVWYNTVNSFYGFQFDIYGIDINGDILAEDLESVGLNIEYYKFIEQGFTRVLGYYHLTDTNEELSCINEEENGCIPSGCGSLFKIISYNGTITGISNIVFGGYMGSPISIEYYSP